ncbi:hypothetical protein A2957_02855 [Candidatus Roizmanbacteria bacterium RIFCSPLOWO2_01_FULL_38_11]|uniref:Uncharacterized protein n=1 Tax=Candidatus Roizmanbacteria bacterium RIFCSPLOWO2_01_FULL_38_11 TaxID=1802060 RepID=A0A1F7IJX4_9BACT|nr:MAG: hypothetical protein A2957_02855 [Candidatus Roizmanbacteria bacterium RIFCSPLOWO2_01_FULL_38_11]
MDSYTVYTPVNEILNILLERISLIIGNQFVGFYLFGSLALNDFVPDRSDIDIVVTTKTILAEDQLEELQQMHKELIENKVPYSDRMECIYIPIDSLRNYVKEKSYFPCLHNGGEFYRDGFGLLEKHVLRERGVILKGPDPKSFMKSVSLSELQKAARESLTNWWLPKLNNSTSLADDDYQTFAILTMCRALYTIEKGNIVSKSEAAIYAKTEAEEYSSLIEEALAWKIGGTFNKLQQTLDFMKFTFHRVGIGT